MAINSKSLPSNTSAIVAIERARISAIMESPEGIMRPKAALQLALRSDMVAASAIEFLQSVPADNPYLLAMDREGSIHIGNAVGSSVGPTDKRADRMAEISGSMKHYNQTQGYTKPNGQA